MAAEKTSEEMVALRAVRKDYQRGAQVVRVLEDVSLSVAPGSFVGFMGPSGSGKSTLLNLIAGIDRPSAGQVVVAGQEISALNDRGLSDFRARTLGFVFQQYNLLPVLTALENVALPLQLTGLSARERRRRAETALRIVGLEARKDHYPRQLSGGQEQRVAIARAIVNDPRIIVADEPTGDLDRVAADEILTLLETLARDLGTTVLMVTHDPVAAERTSVQHSLVKGRLV